MNRDFIRIKELDGELKISHKSRDFGITVSTMEFVLHKPHVNYHVKLANITGILPFDSTGFKPIPFVNRKSSQHEITNIGVGPKLYKVYAKDVVMHNRSGLSKLGEMQFVIPLLTELLTVIAEYGGLGAIDPDQP